MPRMSAKTMLNMTTIQSAESLVPMSFIDAVPLDRVIGPVLTEMSRILTLLVLRLSLY